MILRGFFTNLANIGLDIHRPVSPHLTDDLRAIFKYWMNKNQIKEFVESVAVVKALDPKSDSKYQLEGEEINQVVYDGQRIELSKTNNPTLGIKLVELKPVFRACELSCGDIIANQRIEYRLQHPDDGCWRVRCTNCGRTVNPDGGFLGSHEVGVYFAERRRRPNK